MIGKKESTEIAVELTGELMEFHDGLFSRHQVYIESSCPSEININVFNKKILLNMNLMTVETMICSVSNLLSGVEKDMDKDTILNLTKDVIKQSWKDYMKEEF